MACWINVACCFTTLCICIGLISLMEFSLGIYLTFIQKDFININRLIKTNQYDSYLFYVLLVFIGLGLLSFVLAFLSIYSIYRKLKSLSIFVTIFWIFSIILNLLMLIILLLYYFLVLPQLRTLLVRTLEKSPMTISNQLDELQSKYICCGFTGKDDYKALSLDPFPSSCCRLPNCWRDTDINDHIASNTTISLMHTNGCYPTIEKYVIVELAVLAGVAAICAGFQFFAIVFLCVLYQRLKKFDEHSKFTIDHLGNALPIGESHSHIQTSTQSMEITQI